MLFRSGVVRREAGYCCGVRAASLGVCVPMVLYAVCAGRLAVCAAESGSARARARAGVRARLRGAGSASCRRGAAGAQCGARGLNGSDQAGLLCRLHADCTAALLG